MRTQLKIILIGLVCQSCKQSNYSFVFKEAQRDQKIIREKRKTKPQIKPEVFAISERPKRVSQLPILEDSIKTKWNIEEITVSDSNLKDSVELNKSGPLVRADSFSSPPKKEKPASKNQGSKKYSKFIKGLLIALSLWYPLMIIGLPLFAFYTKKKKKQYPELAEDFQKSGKFWGNFSFFSGLIGLVSALAGIILGLGFLPILVSTLAITSGLVSLILKPKKNRKAMWGLIFGGLPVLLGIIFILILTYAYSVGP